MVLCTYFRRSYIPFYQMRLPIPSIQKVCRATFSPHMAKLIRQLEIRRSISRLTNSLQPDERKAFFNLSVSVHQNNQLSNKQRSSFCRAQVCELPLLRQQKFIDALQYLYYVQISRNSIHLLNFSHLINAQKTHFCLRETCSFTIFIVQFHTSMNALRTYIQKYATF